MSRDAINMPPPVDTGCQPVILLGMHRSGTSLIARLLDDLGLFQGAELQDDHESTHFLEINETLLKRVGATWDHPAPFGAFLQDTDAAALTAHCLAEDVSGPQFTPFLGRTRFGSTGGLRDLNAAWGWKDPRTVFTLPLWLRLFPGAKLVYIIRNGVDVASSLRVREQRELDRRIAELDRKRKQRRMDKHSLLQRAGFKGSARCLTLHGAFSLWEQYVEEAERQLAAVLNERIVICYEKFLADPLDPSSGLAALARFCGVNASDTAVKKAVGSINAGRAAAFLKQPELLAFYREIRSSRWMARYGYEAMDA